ncbi:MAG TPA: acyl-CoA dehydratase activase [Methylomusa anaerophila]|uniref:Activator of (R)-2-hydroxyglutaryl-CoA dehydratase n=1 Tax=Methylomusa anaerophila TaxID=1930071 RepID=A0A348ANN5_9FIRM|nr:acyl-CoA dehydratase activase [Methylomusa anaerophila]BBB92683.1 activator of (R)-2-hydroxyglutaryl-CoA dehydratase [Methylomusa anaerophila]HML87464.1 acyl-CoA dehydratase activase [Methylomusa anaerophila]
MPQQTDAYLGIDVGSVSTNIAVLDPTGKVVDTLYIRTQGQPINAIQQGLKKIKEQNPGLSVGGVGTTGSGRHLAGIVVGADTVKNEITAHAVAAMHIVPEVQTVIEIGGQDSKIIIIRNGIVTDFAMNTVCAAGTGSFLDQQAARLNIPIEKFGEMALESMTPLRVAGRCAVFAESDMIHKQQTGHQTSDILNGLCQALARNYINNIGKGKQIKGPVLFQGGVAANKGMKRAFEEVLGLEVVVPPYHNVMGAIGAALLAREHIGGQSAEGTTLFRGFAVVDYSYVPRSFECSGCPNLCEVVEIGINDQVAARWGDRCGKWSDSIGKAVSCEKAEKASVPL